MLFSYAASATRDSSAFAAPLITWSTCAMWHGSQRSLTHAPSCRFSFLTSGYAAPVLGSRSGLTYPCPACVFLMPHHGASVSRWSSRAAPLANVEVVLCLQTASVEANVKTEIQKLIELALVTIERMNNAAALADRSLPAAQIDAKSLVDARLCKKERQARLIGQIELRVKARAASAWAEEEAVVVEAALANGDDDALLASLNNHLL